MHLVVACVCALIILPARCVIDWAVIEHAVLQSVYSLTSGNGWQLHGGHSWQTMEGNATYCDWLGVACCQAGTVYGTGSPAAALAQRLDASEAGSGIAIECAQVGRIAAIQLPGVHLRGSLPLEALFGLAHVQLIDLSGNPGAHPPAGQTPSDSKHVSPVFTAWDSPARALQDCPPTPPVPTNMLTTCRTADLFGIIHEYTAAALADRLPSLRRLDLRGTNITVAGARVDRLPQFLKRVTNGSAWSPSGKHTLPQAVPCL